MDSHIVHLRQRIQSLERSGGQTPYAASALPFNYSSIDEHLPQGGLPQGALHEVSASVGLPHETAATLFIAGIIARMQGPVLWCVKAPDLFAPGLARVGLQAERIIFAEAGDEKTILIIMEEGLHYGGLAAVVGEVTRLPLIAARRLHLAARSSGITAFTLYRQSNFKTAEIKSPTAAVTRWRITALPSAPLPVAGIGRSHWQIELTRCRDAEAAVWETEACDEKGYLGVPSNMADRQIETSLKQASA